MFIYKTNAWIRTFKILTRNLFDNSSSKLIQWTPDLWPIAADWRATVNGFLATPVARALALYVQNRLDNGATVYPPAPFRALEITPLDSVKVVILGQDPYHGPGQAQGLAFSVPPGIRVPPSLRNIQKEIARDKTLASAPGQIGPSASDGSLERWARQGVLLLNTCLTVEDGLPASHAKRGWEVLTDNILQAVSRQQVGVIFLLWGAHAQAKRPQLEVTSRRHLVLTANHPSPLSALRPPQPFIGCGHFGLANRHLLENGKTPIAW